MIGTDPLTDHTIDALADLGVRLAIDDFGSGYSNLTYLRRLPLDELELDGSYLHEVRCNEPATLIDARLGASMISMAHVLELSVTAEGIETQAQVDRLASIGCDAGQGTHLGAPADPAELSRSLHLG